MWTRHASVSLLSPDGLTKVVILASLDADELLLSFQGLKLPYQVSHSPNPSIIVLNTPCINIPVSLSFISVFRLIVVQIFLFLSSVVSPPLISSSSSSDLCGVDDFFLTD